MKISLEQFAHIEGEILKRVRTHPGISRIALSRSLGIAPSTVGSYVGRLIAAGFLAESEQVDREMGRPPTSLWLNPGGGQFIGVDFEARNIMAVAVDFSARCLRQAHKDIQPSDTVPRIIAKIERAILEVLPGKQERLLAIGVGVPGLVDPVKGVAVDYKYIKGWRQVALAAPLAKRFGVPVYLENTIRSMALAELWFGLGRGVRDWLCIGIRSGIGSGIVTGGQLQRGAHYQSGEIGRWACAWPALAASRYFRPAGAAKPGNAELQDIASAHAVLDAWVRAQRTRRKGRRAQSPASAFEDMVRATQQEDALTVEIIAVAAEVLGRAVGQLALALNPSRVIIAGPLTLLGDTLLDPLRMQVQKALQPSGAVVPEILNSTMGEYNGALGAAALAVHEWKPTGLRV
jgi:N-acetylglucosamine repressor